MAKAFYHKLYKAINILDVDKITGLLNQDAANENYLLGPAASQKIFNYRSKIATAVCKINNAEITELFSDLIATMIATNNPLNNLSLIIIMMVKNATFTLVPSIVAGILGRPNVGQLLWVLAEAIKNRLVFKKDVATVTQFIRALIDEQCPISCKIGSEFDYDILKTFNDALKLKPGEPGLRELVQIIQQAQTG